MKILWIEDGGGGLHPPQLVSELFQGLLPIEVFRKNYDRKQPVWAQLPALFEKHSQHQINMS
jgi:hypothetical protein